MRCVHVLRTHGKRRQRARLRGKDHQFKVRVHRGSPVGLTQATAWKGDGIHNNSGFGCSVSGAGDVNGDGFADIIVGAKNMEQGQKNEGMAFVFYGGLGRLGRVEEEADPPAAGNANPEQGPSTPRNMPPPDARD